MHAHRHARARRFVVALTAPFALLLALPTTAHAAEPVSPPAPGTTAPSSVLASIAPGGQAYRTAAHYILDAPDSETAVAKGLTLGTPHALLYYDDADRVASTIGGDELVSPTGGVEWVVLAHQGDETVGMFTLRDDGQVDSYGGGDGAAFEIIVEALPADTLLLVAGPPVRSSYYTLSDDRRIVTPSTPKRERPRVPSL
ncbi:hypothetical protein GCM10025864_17700 [Luteimicrobium album]|uniref:Uncharacterized protein n=1 Tax=Luteimicrobium album TaxID=1054550 RepID=A0ABQ6HZV6_9MICO|nr:hypothetical protein [Luteimicrobium album]GMA24011.1 hypothetical protein GCM10025864_17700 [Luteimicrobium album]